MRCVGKKLTSMLAAFALCICICIITPMEPRAAASARIKVSQIDIKKINGKWVSVKKGTNRKVNYTGVAQNKHGWWRVLNGVVDFSANGIYQNEYGWWKTTNGKVTFSDVGVFQNEHGWWRVEDSKVNFDAYGIYQNKHGWWYVESGKVIFAYDGIAANEHGVWYINNGKVDFRFNGACVHKGVAYSVENGRVTHAFGAEGKRIIFFGDSISSGYMIAGEKRDDHTRSAPQITMSLLGAEIENRSYAGQSFAHRDKNRSIAEDSIHRADMAEFDMVVLAAGINDYFGSVPMGGLDDASFSTFCGALGIVLRDVEEASMRRLGIGLQPIEVVIFGIGYNFRYGGNSRGITIGQYNECIRNCASQLLLLSPYELVMVEAINHKTWKSYTTDGLHPNMKGTYAVAIDYVTSLVQ